MDNLPLWDMVLKLVVAVILGGLIGLERETHGRPAGLRTHILVCLGSALFTLCSFTIAAGLYDPGRITAQIVTGIGFLGAGTILRQGSVVRGLTTAASIWTVAAIGIAVAIGGVMYYVAIVATTLVVVSLNIIPQIERYLLLRREERLLTMTVRMDLEAVQEALDIIGRHDAQVRVIGSEESVEPGTQLMRVRLRVGPRFDSNVLGAELVASRAVLGYSWE